MRLFYFLLCLSLPNLSYSAPCTSASFPAGGGMVACDSLTIDSSVNFAPNAGAAPLEFIVTGDVVINADINISGADGTSLSIDPSTPGGTGGPGASEGGGLIAAQGESGSDLDPADGNSHVHNGVCNHGGGGAGGILAAGQDGVQCPTGALPVGISGLASGFPALFRGGFGGGSGGAFPVGGGLYDLGAGGGGGGGIHIQAGGTITIKNGVQILARGGRGGNSINLGGAGGGGSGGVIWLESPFPLINNGIFDVRGGDGGVNTKAADPKGGAGGSGGDGVFRSEIAGVITDVSGFVSFATSSAKLKSDISCGTIIQTYDDSKMTFQMIMGFALAMILAGLIKILSRFPMIASWKSVFRN